MLSRRTILLKPMQPALSGYIRLQKEGESLLLQLHARGLEPGQVVRLYWYLNGQAAKLIAEAGANVHGEVSAEAEATGEVQNRLQAVLVIGGQMENRPLLIGLCAQQDALSLLDAKNAAMALCEKLNAARRPKKQPEPESVPAAQPASSRLPREVFLPAIDPSPYLSAAEKEKESMLPPPKPAAPPADRLKPLSWPRGFESLKPYFDKALPTALFQLPGWRFVYAAHAGGPNGLWIGIRQRDGRVCGVAYAHRGDAPPAAGKGYRPMRGTDGQMYQVLWQEI